VKPLEAAESGANVARIVRGSALFHPDATTSRLEFAVSRDDTET
jgi:hypothetical protein